MIRRAALLFYALAMTGCATSPGVTTGYYDIEGNDDRALDRSISQLGPMGGHAFAATELQILPIEITTTETEFGCAVGNASFKVKANIILPRWKDRSQASPDLRAGFDNYAEYAVLHEKTHVRIAEAAAIVMGAAVKKIPAQKNCDELYRQVKLTIAKVQKKHNSLQLEFDASEKQRIGLLLAKAN